MRDVPEAGGARHMPQDNQAQESMLPRVLRQ
eukprot:SAG11_NODE_16157_length_555_cov_1.848684_2_plen_30_part_01